MSRRTRVADRLATLAAGLAVAAGGLVVLDLHHRVVAGGRLDLGPVRDVVTGAWWPWASAAGGVLVGLVALAWLLAHLRRPSPGPLRLADSGPTGRLDVDLGSVADATADRLAATAPVAGVTGVVLAGRTGHVVELRAVLDEGAEARAVVEAATSAAAELDEAFPDGDVAVRLLVQAPRPTRARRRDVVRVR